MARRPSLNALQGYSYQGLVYFLLIAKMDVDREIHSVEAENPDDAGNFDDVKVETKNLEKFRFQIKHSVTTQIFTLAESGISYNGEELTLSPDVNVLVMDNCPSVTANSMLFGIPAQQCGNLYVVNLSATDVVNTIKAFYRNENRLIQTLELVTELHFSTSVNDLKNAWCLG